MPITARDMSNFQNTALQTSCASISSAPTAPTSIHDLHFGCSRNHCFVHIVSSLIVALLLAEVRLGTLRRATQHPHT